MESTIKLKPNQSKVTKKPSDWHVMEFCVPITEAVSDGKDFMIKGVAINETTTRNGITYVAEELSRAAPSFRNKPILKDHNPLIENIVGRTTENVAWNDTNKRIDFEARIVDEKIKGMIEKGLITDVSIGAKVEDIIENKKAGTLTAVGMEGLEISLVAVPGDPGANIANAMHESFSLKEDSTTKLTKEGNKMTDETITKDAEEVKPEVEDTKEEPVAEEEKDESETEEKLKVATEKLMKYEAKEADAKFKIAVAEEVKKQLKEAEDNDTEKEVEAEAEDDTKAVEKPSSEEKPMEDETKGDVAGEEEDTEEATESMTLESADTGKGFAMYREYDRDDSGKLKRLVRA